MNKKQSLTSNISKLLANLDRLEEFKKIGKLRAINLDFAPTNMCNGRCNFCSVMNRDRTLEISLERSLEVSKNYIRNGIRSIVLTGGGEPLLWKHCEEYIMKCKKLNPDLKFGLITNGISLHKYSQDFLKNFEWIRVSINEFVDYETKTKFEIPKEIFLSFNYVVNSLSTKDIFKTIDRLKEINDKYHPKAIKIQNNVLDNNLDNYNSFIGVIQDEDLTNFFYSIKSDDKVPNKCFMSHLKPHLHADGNVYRCSVCALDKQRYPKEFIIDYENLKPQDFDTKQCKRCFFYDQNTFIEMLEKEIIHEEFI